MPQDWQGREVTEEECAHGLGFKDVHEFRRWKTDVGHLNNELQHEVRRAKDEARHFRWHGLRMDLVLAKLDDLLMRLTPGLSNEEKREVNLHRLGIGVVRSKVVDWNHELKDWGLDRSVEDLLWAATPGTPTTPPTLFLNRYTCYRCDHKWDDVYECAVDDDCPACGARNCTPCNSELIKQ